MGTHRHSLSFLWLGPIGILLLAPSPVSLAEPPSSWRSVGVGGGGGLFAPSFSPHSPDELFTTSDMSDVFHTTDLGEHWTTLPFQEIQGGRACQVLFTQDPNRLYALDLTSIGGAETRIPSVSSDGGQTWIPLQADPTNQEAYSFFCDPSDSNRLILTDWSRLYFSNNGGQSFDLKMTYGAATNGLYPGGVFWDGTNIFVGTNGGLLVSTNGGSSFSFSAIPGIPAGKEIISLCGAKQGNTLRLFALVDDAGSIYPGILIEDLFWVNKDVYTLDWGQPSWTPKNNGLPTEDGYAFAYIASALNDVSICYVAGQSPNEEPLIYKTTNAGTSWTSVFTPGNNANAHTGWEGHQGDRGWSYGGGTVGFTVALQDPARAAWTDYGFLHLTTDGGTTWRQGYLNPADQNPAGAPTPKGRAYRGVGLEDTSCWWLAWSSPERIFACFTDIRGIRTEDAGQSWSFDYSGHTENTAYHCARNPQSGLLYLATSTVHDLYQSTYLTDSSIDGGGGRVLFSADQGETWQLLHDFSHPVVWLALDPNNSNRLFASVVHSTQGDIYVSENIHLGAGSTWTPLAAPPRTQGHPFNIHVLTDGTLASTYSGRRTNAGFTASSGVFLSSDNGQSWQDRSDPGMLYWTKDLVLDPHDPLQNTWYVGVFSGWGGPPNGLGGLYRSADRGQNWERISDLDRVTSCTFHPSDPEQLFLTTEMDGLWRTENLSDPNPSFSRVESYPFRQPERVFYNPYNPSEIWVTSFGNGLRIGESAGATSSGWRIF